MSEDLDFIEERPGIIIYKALFITDDPMIFHSNCRGKTRRIDLKILAVYSQDNDVILINIRSRKLRSFIKKFLLTHLYNLYIHLTGEVKETSLRKISEIFRLKEIDNPDKELLKDSLLILVQKDGEKIVVKECDDRLIRLNL